MFFYTIPTHYVICVILFCLNGTFYTRKSFITSFSFFFLLNLIKNLWKNKLRSIYKPVFCFLFFFLIVQHVGVLYYMLLVVQLRSRRIMGLLRFLTAGKRWTFRPALSISLSIIYIILLHRII